MARISVVGPLVGGSAPITRSVVRALERLKHQVEFIDLNGAFGPAVKFLQEAELQKPLHNGLFDGLLQSASLIAHQRLHKSRPDLALFMAQSPAIYPTDFALLKQLGIRTAFWFIEDFRMMTYWQTRGGMFDEFWVIQDPKHFASLKESSPVEVRYVPLGCDPSIHHRPASPVAAQYDVTFAGTGYPNRIGLLFQLSAGLHLWGTHWEGGNNLTQFPQHGVFEHDRFADIVHQSKINLNLSSSNDINASDPQDFVNPRAFEIAGCGGFQLVDGRMNVSEFFEPGKEVVTFNGREDLQEKVNYYLAHEAERERVASAGYERAHRDHTLDARLAGALGGMGVRA